jgi:release factor glutamine methyltransferase
MFSEFFKTYEAFKGAGFSDPLQETLKILDIVSNGSVRNMQTALHKEVGFNLQSVIEQRLRGKPIEFILGKATFMGLHFFCTPSALIPREETELLARIALDIIRDRGASDEPLMVVDMCTGCGNLAVALAVHAANIRVLASDVSPEAIDLARSNLTRYKLQSRVSLFCGNLFTPLAAAGYAGCADIIVCNPPYIPASSLSKMASETIRHEPTLAFDAGAFGIDIFRRLIAESPVFLKPGGGLVFEIGEGQEKIVTRLLERSREYENILYYHDHSNKVRVVSAARANT